MTDTPKDRDALIELIARLEAAAEGSRELDCWIAIHPSTPSVGVVKGGGMKTIAILLMPRSRGIGDEQAEEDFAEFLPKTNADDLGVPCYTTSIDAALTLARNKEEYWFALHCATYEAANLYNDVPYNQSGGDPEPWPCIRAALVSLLKARQA